jgi:ribosomal protein S27AE
MTLGTTQHRIARPKQRKTLAREYCPRCNGIMMLEFDLRAGYHRFCINCGHIKYLNLPVLTQKSR